MSLSAGTPIDGLRCDLPRARVPKDKCPMKQKREAVTFLNPRPIKRHNVCVPFFMGRRVQI
jgi:hypothetical protein